MALDFLHIYYTFILQINHLYISLIYIFKLHSHAKKLSFSYLPITRDEQ